MIIALSYRRISIVLLIAISAGCASLEQKTPPPTLSVELQEGSRIIGTPDVFTIPVQSSFGKINIPLAQMTTLTVDKQNSVQVSMNNLDRISGIHAIRKLKLKTVFGDITIDPSLLRKITRVDVPVINGTETNRIQSLEKN